MGRPLMGKRAKQIQDPAVKLTVGAGGLGIVKSVAYNVHQDLIVVTRDKVELCLTKHVKMMEQRKAWLVPFGVLLSAVVALATSTFHDSMGLKAEAWHAVFIVLGVISGGLTLYLLFTNWVRAKSIEQV